MLSGVFGEQICTASALAIHKKKIPRIWGDGLPFMGVVVSRHDGWDDLRGGLGGDREAIGERSGAIEYGGILDA